MADGKATRKYTGARPTHHRHIRTEEPNRKFLMTRQHLEPGLGRQVHTITRRDPTTMKLHRNTAPMAMGRMGVNSPSSEMYKREETRESRGRQHFLNNKATRRALPPISSLCFTCLHRHFSEFLVFSRAGSISLYPPHIWHVWKHRVFDTLTSLLAFDCLQSVLLELSYFSIFAPAMRLKRNVHSGPCLALSTFQSTFCG